jgi:hypothetical protein
LGLRGRCHERNQGVTDGLLHRIGRGARIEAEAVDNCLNRIPRRMNSRTVSVTS